MGPCRANRSRDTAPRVFGTLALLDLAVAAVVVAQRMLMEYFGEHLLGDYYRGNGEIK